MYPNRFNSDTFDQFYTVFNVYSTLCWMNIWTNGTIFHYIIYNCMCFSIKTIKHILMTWCIPIVFNTDTFGQFHTVLTLPAAWWSCELMGPFFRSCNCMCFSVKTYPGALNPQCKQVRVPLQQVPRLLRENYAALSSSSKQHKPLYEVTPPSHIPYTSAAAVLPLPTQTPLEIDFFLF